MNNDRIIRPANGIGPVTTLGAKKEAEKRSASEHRRNKKAEREWHPVRNLHPGEGLTRAQAVAYECGSKMRG